jgi:hypothetical protein
MYLKPGCPFGLRLRIALVLHRVRHRSVRFRDDEDGAARVRAVNDGNAISPTVYVAGRWLTNPSWREVRGAVPEAGQLRVRVVSVVLATVAVLLVGCGSDDKAATQSPADTSKPASASTSEAPPAASPLEGTWRAGPITLEDTEATIRTHGLNRYVKAYRENAPFFGDTVLSLTIENGEWDLYGLSDGGEPAPIDYDAEYEIDDDTVVFHHSDGSNTYRWQVDHDTLTLHFVESTLPGYRGIPDEVFQRALYMTSTFTRHD